MVLQQAVTRPNLDRLEDDAEPVCHLVHGQQAAVTEAVVSRSEMIDSPQPCDQTGIESAPDARRIGLRVQMRGNVPFRVIRQESIDFCDDGRRRLTELPGGQRQRQLQALGGPASPLPRIDPLLLGRSGPGEKQDREECRAEPLKGGMGEEAGRETLWFSPLGGRGKPGIQRSAVATMSVGDAWVSSDVTQGVLEGAPGIPVGIGTAAWTRAVDEACIDRVRVVSLLEERADPRPVLA